MNSIRTNGKYILTPTAEELAILTRAHAELGATVLSDLVADYCRAWQRAFALKDKTALVKAFDKASPADQAAMIAAKKAGG